VLILPAPESQIRAAVFRALVANGYVESAGSEWRTVATSAHRLGGDTSLTVRAEVVPEDPAGGGVVVVVSGTYSAPAVGIRRARVVQRPGEQSPLYARLRAVADSTRRFAAPAP
jgi:hypothetical protein